MPLDRITRLPEKSLSVLGIMSGTSMDAVDFALCSIGLKEVRLQKNWHRCFPPRLRARLLEAAAGRASSYEVGQLHHDLGRFYAAAAKSIIGRAGLDLVGLHGQTIFHQPHPPAATFQIGEPAYLAEMLRVPVVSNFRAADLAAGGQGAPLATLFHKVVFGEKGRRICVNNLGGISNVTAIDWQGRTEPRILAFDTGPANVLLDLAAQRLTAGKKRFDENGRWAARGQSSHALVERWLKHPFFKRRPPKSTGRELFGEAFLQSAWQQMRRARLSRFDMLATLTEFTSRSIALNYELHLQDRPDRVVLCGGGAANRILVRSIEQSLSAVYGSIEVITSAELGWPLQAVEPAAFALLAYYRWNHWPGNIPATTGARRVALLGQIAEP